MPVIPGIIASSRPQASGETSEQIVTGNYNTLAGATTDESTALLTFTDTLVANDIYKKVVAFYPLVGSSLNNKRFNLMNPLDDISAFRISVIGAPTDHAKGIQLNANSNKLFTNIRPTYIANASFIGFMYYAQQAVNPSANSGKVMTLCNSAGTEVSGNFSIDPNFTSKSYPQVWDGSLGLTAATVSGFNYHQRQISTEVELYRNATKYTETRNINSVNDINGSVTVWGSSSMVYQMSCFAVVQALTDAEVIVLRDAVNTLMSTLGR